MDPNRNTISRLFIHSPIESKDELEEKFEQSYVQLNSIISGLSEKEAHDAVNSSVYQSTDKGELLELGFVVGILIEPQSATRYFRDLSVITRDGFGTVLNTLNELIGEKYLRLHDNTRNQLLWLLRELMKNSIAGTENVCISLLRQIAGGDNSTKNVWLAETMLDVLTENKIWLEKNPFVMAISVYTYLRLLIDHNQITNLANLRQREIDFCVSLLRERFNECIMVGRDLVRVLQNVARIPEIERLWKDLLHNPSSLHPTFTGILQLLTTRTSRSILQSRITPDMEKKMLFLTTQVKFGHQKHYQDWFLKQYLSTPESQSLRCDLIRYICGCIHPTNEQLGSEIIPRWAVIGWLLTTCNSNAAASNAKLSLFYDWFFFDPRKDSIMHIEPAILVMHFSMRPHPTITATLLDFLCRIMPNFCQSLTTQVRQGVYTSLRHILDKKVLPSLSSLFDNPKIDKELRAMIKESFSEFCSSNEIAILPGRNDEVNNVGNQIVMRDHIDTPCLPTNDDNLVGSEEAQFSEDEDDIPLGKLKLTRDVKFRPIVENSKPIDIDQQLIHLTKEVRETFNSLKNEKDTEASCELMEKLLQTFLQEDEFDQDQTNHLGACLAHVFHEELARKIFPEEVNEETIEDSIGTPLFVLCRNLCQTPEEDPSRHPLLAILSELACIHRQVGFYLLYYMHASKMVDTSAYKDYLKTQESKDDFLSGLLADLKLCQERDVRMFCYIIPYVYNQFKESVIGNVELLHLVVSCIDPLQLQELLSHTCQGNMTMFRRDSVVSVLKSSLSWESWEQYGMWRFIEAHNIPIDSILPILNSLDYQAHAEAMSSLLMLLIKEKPSTDLLRQIMCRDVKMGDQFSVSLLKFWCQDHEEELAELIASQLTKATPIKRKRQGHIARNNVLPTVEHTLAHLDQLRQNSKEITFFSLGSLQSSLIQIQNSCSDAQKTKYSDLFALVEDIEDMKHVKTSRSSGRGKSNYKSTAKSKTVIQDSDTETESSEEEESYKKPPRKKKKTTIQDYDSD